MNIYKSIDSLVGRTPLMLLEKTMEKEGLSANVMAKLEYFNPAGSVKDRAALYMINDAERSGLLKEGGVIVEPTSGNTGIGLAAIGVSRGYRVILTMPDTMSEERRNLLKAFGAEIVLTEGALGMKGAIEKAKEILSQNEGSFMPSQFENGANARAHFETTGPEIFEDTEGKVDIFVAGVGTGGTLTGIARYLRSKSPLVQIVAVEPAASPLLSGGESAPHPLQGIGANFVPKVLDTSLIDRIITVSGDEAFEAAKELVRSEGILTGISSGAALFAAKKLAKEDENAGKNIVVLLPDTGERYLSTGVFF
ncbi:MAG: cysteine synthase A [Ruminococcus sp.]|nr:cysteine synthase A [Ruminococcus sp.]